MWASTYILVLCWCMYIRRYLVHSYYRICIYIRTYVHCMCVCVCVCVCVYCTYVRTYVHTCVRTLPSPLCGWLGFVLDQAVDHKHSDLEWSPPHLRLPNTQASCYTYCTVIMYLCTVCMLVHTYPEYVPTCTDQYYANCVNICMYVCMQCGQHSCPPDCQCRYQ